MKDLVFMGDSLQSASYLPLPRYLRMFSTRTYDARFLATIEDADVWAGPHHFAIQYSTGSYVIYSGDTERPLLPAGPIGDYIHSYRQLIR